METMHLSALRTKHANLEAKIAAEAMRPMPDSVLLHRLKKEKLRLKEAMASPG